MTNFYIKHNGSKEACQMMFKFFHGHNDPWIDEREQKTLEEWHYYVCDSDNERVGRFAFTEPDCREFTFGRRRLI